MSPKPLICFTLSLRVNVTCKHVPAFHNLSSARVLYKQAEISRLKNWQGMISVCNSYDAQMALNDVFF